MSSDPFMSFKWAQLSPSLSSPSFAGFTALCCLFALFTLRFAPRSSRNKRRKACGCDCSCDRSTAENGGGEMAVDSNEEARERLQVGSSMMEQLVPEITTHALSYLDYKSLCRLSMANSAMRRAANDDGAWRALYCKDFTGEQNTVTPANGWKAYYAATKAIISVNAQFYNIIREGSLPAMSQFWLNADYVKCNHGAREIFSGYSAVMDSWAIAFNWEDQGGDGVTLEIRDVRARVMSGMAWVNLTAHVDLDTMPVHVTNVYEFHNGRWYMVHHHSSQMIGDEDEMENDIFA